MNELILSELKSKLHGYTKVPKGDFVLLSIGMKEEVWMMYSFCRCILADWDKKHKRYQHLRFDHRSVDEIMHWKKSKTSRMLNALLDIGAIKLIDKITRTYMMIEIWNTQKHKTTPFGYIEDLLNAFEKSARKPELVIKMREKLYKKIESFTNMGNVKEDCTIVTSKTKPIYKDPLTRYGYVSHSDIDINHKGFDEKDMAWIDKQQEGSARKLEVINNTYDRH